MLSTQAILADEGGVTVDGKEVQGHTLGYMLDCIRRAGGDVAVERVLDAVGVGDEDCLRGSSWWPREVKLALLEAASTTLDDPRVGWTIGASLFDHSVIPGTKLALRVLGSPQQVMRFLPRITTRFLFDAVMEATETTSTSARVRYRVEDGFRPHRLDCQYQEGMLSQIGPMFGLPPAKVVHVSCQVDGAEACTYEVRWQRYSLTPWRRRRRERHVELEVLREQAQAAIEDSAALRATIADLVSDVGLEAVLVRIGERAVDAGLAEGLILNVRGGPDASPIVWAHGVRGPALAEILEGLEPPIASLPPKWFAVDVASFHGTYGQLVAVEPFDGVRIEEARVALEVYANYAALALDVDLAFEQARADRDLAESLLELGRELAEAVSRDEVARKLAPIVRQISGADLTSVLLWEPATRNMRMSGFAGFPEGVEESLARVVIAADDAPDIDRMLNSPRPRRMTSDGASGGEIRALAEQYGTFGGITWPIVARGELLGILWFGAKAGSPSLKVTPALAKTMGAVAGEASIALERARLLEGDQEVDRRVELGAYRDQLTGLANATLFRERLSTVIEQARRYGRHVAVISVDLDRFGLLNNQVGRGVGDAMLVEVGERLRAVVRDDDLVARIGSDEFGLLCGVREPGDGATIARHLIEVLGEPFEVGGIDARPSITASLGVAVGPGQGEDGEVLLASADIAMHRAREMGGAAFVVYEPSMGTQATARFTMEAQLRRAIEHGELVLHYQPQIDLITGRIVGAEALVRWQHPELGLLLPAAFISIAEESGLIVPLGEQVLREACRQAHAWQEQGLRPVTMAVNVSIRQIQRQGDFVNIVRGVLEETGFDSRYLELEMTESFSAHNLDTIATTLQGLRDAGIRVAIDDFGTGYAFFGYVQRFPIGRVKIDQSFVQEIGGANEEGAIVRGMLDLTLRLGMDVVAEGVETGHQLEFLRRHGCQQAQGYLFGYPVHPDAFEQMLAEDRSMIALP